MIIHMELHNLFYMLEENLKEVKRTIFANNQIFWV